MTTAVLAEKPSVARDIAARLGRPVRQPAVANPQGQMTSMVASADIADPDLCGRLTVSVLRRVVVGESPAWVRRRLESAGMRPINNVVDASNLVMLELGQPTHPYDANKVAGRTLRARRARAGEMLVTLDGVERTLATAGRGLGDTGVDCVIVDGDDTVLGLAGIMGGASSEISANTTEVLLEAAYFDPMTIARSSKRHGLRSEASSRFERGVDPNLGLRAAARAGGRLAAGQPGRSVRPLRGGHAGAGREPAQRAGARDDGIASAAAVEVTTARPRAHAGPAHAHSAPVPTLATSALPPITPNATPSAVPRRCGGAASATIALPTPSWHATASP